MQWTLYSPGDESSGWHGFCCRQSLSEEEDLQAEDMSVSMSQAPLDTSATGTVL